MVEHRANSDLDEEPTKEVEVVMVVLAIERGYPFRERSPPAQISEQRICATNQQGGARKLRQSKDRHPQQRMAKCHAGRDGFLAGEPNIRVDKVAEIEEGT